MKTIIFTLSILATSFFASSQIVSNQYTIYTVDKDTLYIKNDPVGKLIYSSWETGLYVDNEKKPIIILVDDLAVIRKKYTNPKNKNKKS